VDSNCEVNNNETVIQATFVNLESSIGHFGDCYTADGLDITYNCIGSFLFKISFLPFIILTSKYTIVMN